MSRLIVTNVETQNIKFDADTTAFTINSSGAVASGSHGLGGVGIGQTWQDVTSSRAFNTDYTNSTGKPIMVSFIATTGTGDNIQVNVGGVSFGDQYTNQSNGREMSSFIVPDNTVYRINGNTGSTTPVLQKWVELR